MLRVFPSFSLSIVVFTICVFIIHANISNLPQQQKQLAFFEQSNSLGKINRRGVLSFPFTCAPKPHDKVDNVQFELKTSSKDLFVKFIPCKDARQNPEIVKVKLPDQFIYNFDRYQTQMNFDTSLSAVLSVNFQNDQIFVKQDSIRIVLKPVYQRPFKYPNACLTFFGRLSLSQERRAVPECPLDNDVIELIGNRPVVFKGKHFGVVKRLPYVVNKQLQADFQEKGNVLDEVSMSFDLYLLGYPARGLHSIYHQMTIGGFIKNVAPQLLLEPNGDLRVEIAQPNRRTEGFIAHTKLALSTWYRIVVTINAKAVGSLSLCNFNEKSHLSKRKTCEDYTFHFRAPMQYDPYINSFVIGGSLKFNSIHGYVCNFDVYLNRVIRVAERGTKQTELTSQLVDLEIAKFDTQCSNFLTKVESLIYSLKIRAQYRKLRYKSPSIPWYDSITQHDEEHKVCQLSVKVLAKQKFIRSVLNNDILSGINVSFDNVTYLQQLGRALYVKARMALGVGLHEFKHQLVPYVLQSSCLGCSIASYMASVMYFSGFGAPLDEEKGSAYLLRSALLDDRLGLLSLGFKYYYGLNGYPVDMSIAWRYYVDAAWMFHDDREEHKESDVTTEIVRLTDKKALEMYLGKESHYFQWLKMQASQGIESARQELSQMLFWGSKGVDRDTGAAVQYYRQLAQTGDSTGQFDLGIVLLRGQGGVKKNEDDGLSYLKKSADQGHQGAISALGWHYLMKRDYKFAYKYLKMAADRGNPDAMHNLGYMYENGFVHGSPKNNTASYLYFIDAAQRGQPDSALSLSVGQIYGDGIMLQNAQSAAAWARNNAERLSAVGRLLQQGLKSFLKDKFSEALMFYMMAAETGVEVASFNMAYLCENEDASEIANSYIGAHCAYHYYNKSLNSFTPDSYAVNRVGDFYFFGCSAEQPSDVDKAVDHYIWAAELNDPQAFYNLAYISQLGYHIVPELKKSHLHIPPNATLDHESLQFYLFSKCEELEIAADPENRILTPCGIAKYNWLMNKTYKSYKTQIQSASVIVILTMMILLCYLSVYKSGRYFTTPYMLNSV